ncbi:dihydroxyacetone kinase subunit DhaK [Lachnospiraceae bacterium JLR.KK008]
MQRILNDPDNIVEEMLEGFLKAHPDLVEATENPRAIKSVFPTAGRVAVVTGGGSGHKPAFIGFCGENLCDGIAVGEICSSPTAKAFLDTFTAVDGGKGVACLYGNYSGDNMNVKMAVKMAKKQGLTVKTVVCNDDVASAPFTERDKRRGIAGEVVMYKCGGAMAATGADLDEVIRVAQKSVDWTRSAGIGLTPCTLPAVGHPNFEIKDGTMEVGVGPHGEPGMEVRPLETAAGMAKIMTDVVLGDFENDMPVKAGDEICVLINGMGATPLNELYVLYNEVVKLMEAKGIKVYKSYVGNYLTSMDMMGASLTVTKLDGELKQMFDTPVYSMGLRQR